MTEKVDLDVISKKSHYDVIATETVQHKEEHQDAMIARLRREERESKRQHYKDIALFVFCMVIVGGLFGVSVYVFLDSSFSLDDRKWAATILTSIVTGFLGYITGKQARRDGD